MVLEPMTPGGEWLSRSADQEPVYVTNPDNIRHLQHTGWIIVPDPRDDPEVDNTPVVETLEASVEIHKPQGRRRPSEHVQGEDA